jgi:hypothetical protein
MWQAPNQRSRASISNRKRERDKTRRPLHLKRVQAELKVADPGQTPTVTSARVLLNDISPKGMGLFSASPFLPGTEIALTLSSPRQVYLRGRVAWCQEYDVDSKILSKNQFSYRVGIEFLFDSEAEEKSLKAFCEEIFKEHLFSLRAV